MRIVYVLTFEEAALPAAAQLVSNSLWSTKITDTKWFSRVTGPELNADVMRDAHGKVEFRHSDGSLYELPKDFDAVLTEDRLRTIMKVAIDPTVWNQPQESTVRAVQLLAAMRGAGGVALWRGKFYDPDSRRTPAFNLGAENVEPLEGDGKERKKKPQKKKPSRRG